MERDNNYNETNRLQELGGSDFEIADGQPNIKGWTIKNPQGETIGEVEELIFDVQSRKVRYMIVDLENSVLDLEPRDVLVPIGLAELDEDDDEVILPNVTADQLRALPVYEKNRIGRDTETAIRSVFGGLGAAGGATGAAFSGAAYRTGDALTGDRDDDFYDHNHFNDRGLNRNRRDLTDTDYTTADTTRDLTGNDRSVPIIGENVDISKREGETGDDRINSGILEGEENIILREEYISVEHTPVNRPATDSDINAFREGEIELNERGELIRDTTRNTEADADHLDTGTDRPRPDTDTYLTDEERNRNRPTNI